LPACPICKKGAALELVKKYQNFEQYFCLDCRLGFFFSEKDTGSEFYRHSQLYGSRAEGMLYEYAELDWRFQTFFKLSPDRAGEAILDIGCGDGAFIALAKAHGLEAQGIDIDPRAIALAENVRKLKNVRQLSWQEIDNFPNLGKFTAITLFDVLEHTNVPAELLTRIGELLCPQGRLYISVPRLDRFPLIFDQEVDCPSHHFTFWTAKALIVLLEKCGYREIRIIYKPLTMEDRIFYLLVTLRRLSKTPAKIRAEPQGSKGQNNSAYKAKLVKKYAIIMLAPFNWLLAKFGLGRGFTIFATARKD